MLWAFLKFENITNYCLLQLWVKLPKLWLPYEALGIMNEVQDTEVLDLWSSWSKHDLVFAILAVPSRPPSNVQARNTSSKSLLITWGEIPEEFVHGILRGYRVFFGEKETMDENVFTTLPNRTFFLVENLKKFTIYTYRILGFTVKGDGTSSEKYDISTDEDGKMLTRGQPLEIVYIFTLGHRL